MSDGVLVVSGCTSAKRLKERLSVCSRGSGTDVHTAVIWFLERLAMRRFGKEVKSKVEMRLQERSISKT